MRRNGTEIMAIGGILVGAAIGAGGTVALVSNPLDHWLRAQRGCESVYVSSSPMRATWIYTVDRDGEVRKKKCPRWTRTIVHGSTSRTVDAARQAELAARARALATARTREEVVQALVREVAAETAERLRDR